MPDDDPEDDGRDLVTEQGVDEGSQEAEPADVPDPAGPAGILPDEPPASPTPSGGSPAKGPGQELQEGEG